LGLADGSEYRAFLESHEEEWVTLDAFCRVTISRYLRDREVFEALEKVVLPGLCEEARKAEREELHCWSAGCGSGEEAYTLSLLWRLASEGESTASLSHRYPGITLVATATDAEPKVLERAQQAVYPKGALKDLPPDWIQRAFELVDGEFALCRDFQEGVVFLLQDVRETMPEGPFDLILCRNLVFTYFDGEFQGEILSRLLGRLREGGVFVIGGHEALPQGQWPLFQLKPGLPVYRKLEAGSDGNEQIWTMIPEG
jgi:chemotaxis protein methyltransferase CheR